MQKIIDYTSKKSISFQIQIESVQNSDEADHWRYIFKCVDTKSGFKRSYQVMILKSLISKNEIADSFVLGDPIEYLMHVYLDNYADGSHDLIWPDFSRGWFVF